MDHKKKKKMVGSSLPNEKSGTPAQSLERDIVKVAGSNWMRKADSIGKRQNLEVGSFGFISR